MPKTFRIQVSRRAKWPAEIVRALRALGGKATLAQIYAQIEKRHEGPPPSKLAEYGAHPTKHPIRGEYGKTSPASRLYQVGGQDSGRAPRVGRRGRAGGNL